MRFYHKAQLFILMFIYGSGYSRNILSRIKWIGRYPSYAHILDINNTHDKYLKIISRMQYTQIKWDGRNF